MSDHSIDAGSRALNTRRTYLRGIRVVGKWCEQRGIYLVATSAAEFMQYHDEMRSLRKPLCPSTILLHFRAWAIYLQTSGHPDPFKDPSLRQLRTRLHRQVEEQLGPRWQPLRVADLRRMFRLPADTLIEHRNRAMILLMFVCRLSAKKALGLNRSDIRLTDDAYEVTVGTERLIVPSGKTLLCPVEAMKGWLDRTPFQTGPLFPVLTRWENMKPPAKPLYYKSVTDALRSYAEMIGLNAAGITNKSLLEGSRLDHNATLAVGL